MKGLFVSLFIVVIVAAAFVDAASLQGPKSECPDICTFDYRPVCGFDGTCYRIYGNDCGFRSDRCKNKQALKVVEMKKCEEALEGKNAAVVTCGNE